jgi:transcriptional regulator with XRE-family HTH domain
VQNIKQICAIRGIKPTVACRESGAGANLINKMESRGSIPSVEKVQLLAQYLGVTVSELLGEDASETAQGPAQPYLVMRYNQLSQEGQEKVMAFVEFTALQEKQAKKEDE